MNYYVKGELGDGVSIERMGLTQWLSMDGLTAQESAADLCTVEHLQAALSKIEGAEVVSATVNRTGEFQPPEAHWIPNMMPIPPSIGDLPAFCDVRVDLRTRGGHVAKILVWVPLVWNRRFLATGGMGSVTGPLWFDVPTVRTVTMPVALRNGFATAATDAGNRDPRFTEWPLNPETGALDWDLLRNWAYLGTHDMAIVAKAVIKALLGEGPAFSYYAGCSGGGRQGIASVQRYPEDFDGVWTADPAIAWTRFWPRALWPAVVMKEHGNVLPDAKLDAFRDAVIDACDGADGLHDGIIGEFERHDVDPFSLVGEQTEAGQITATDAEVMRKIWDGPRRRNGERIYFGIRPGMTSWGAGPGLLSNTVVDGELVIEPFEGSSYFRWVLEDPGFDWKTLTFDTFEELTDLGIRKLADIAVDDPDLSGLRASGSKLLISQAADDEAVSCDGAIDFYRQVTETLGSESEVADFARLFVTDGDIHGSVNGLGPGLSIATAMSALMEWVENGKAPERLVAERINPATGELACTRPVFPYPSVTRYCGTGDPNDAQSYIASTPADRQNASDPS